MGKHYVDKLKAAVDKNAESGIMDMRGEKMDIEYSKQAVKTIKGLDRSAK